MSCSSPISPALLFIFSALSVPAAFERAHGNEFHWGYPPGHPIAKAGSPNLVGYANIDVTAGWNLMANPLDDQAGNQAGTSPLTKLAMDGTVLLKPGPQGWEVNHCLAGWSQPAFTLRPGEGFFLFTPQTTSLTAVGRVRIGTNTCHLPAGDSLAAPMAPYNQQPLDGTEQNFPAKAGDEIYRLQPGTPTFDRYDFDGNWHPKAPVPLVGEGLWVSRKSPSDWTQVLIIDTVPNVPPDNVYDVYEVSPAAVPSETEALLDFFTYRAGPISSRVYDTDGITPLDYDHLAQLWGRLDGVHLVPLSAVMPFGKGARAGWVDGGLVGLPAAWAGKTVTLQLRCWPRAAGPNYETALVRGAQIGSSAEFACQVGALGPNPDSAILPGITSGFASFQIRPPTTSALHVRRANGRLELRWPSDLTGYLAQSSDAVGEQAAWSNVTVSTVTDGDEQVAVLPEEPTAQFFRLVVP
ncbi:MAG TPA: hypothetical protein VMB21_01645 [Candidatus Limnocylindria bacterium]|nr:hypothetical protein [Candidatus Limnocylindria bacterium]